MKTASIILSSLSILMVFSEMICGLWVKSNGLDPSSISFHTSLGIGTGLVVLIAIIMMLTFVVKRV